jgi:hypothetical protein
MTRLTARETGARLDEVYLEIKELLKKHAPPFKLVDVRVREAFGAVDCAEAGGNSWRVWRQARLQKGHVEFYLMFI